MSGVLETLIGLPPTVTVLGTGAVLGVLMLSAACAARWRQRAFEKRLDARVTHLTTALSLLTNTTEEGMRAAAVEIARLTRAADAQAEAQPQATARQRISVAAGHGRSIQDIAASEQLSEGEVLLHLLMDRLKPGDSSANVC
jgi:hypothetical protein